MKRKMMHYCGFVGACVPLLLAVCLTFSLVSPASADDPYTFDCGTSCEEDKCGNTGPCPPEDNDSCQTTCECTSGFCLKK